MGTIVAAVTTLLMLTSLVNDNNTVPAEPSDKPISDKESALLPTAAIDIPPSSESTACDATAQQPLTAADVIATLTDVRFVLLVGIPACGKSSIGEILEASGYKRFNADSIRGELSGGDESNTKNEGKVWPLLYERLDKAIADGHKILIDNTNVSLKSRSSYVSRTQKIGCTLDIIVLDVPLEECLKRNQKRSRQVPEPAMQRMAATLKREFPTAAEGRVTVVRSGPEVGQFFIMPPSETPLVIR